MRVGIPVFNGRVAPVFDWAGRMLIAEIDGRAACGQEERDIADLPALSRASFLRRAGIDVLICGGISPVLAGLVAAAGIEVIPGIAGDSADVLAAYCEDRLGEERWAMPGWCGRAPRGRGGGCGRRARRGMRHRRGGRGSGPEGGVC